jgi:hypothetical protein
MHGVTPREGQVDGTMHCSITPGEIRSRYELQRQGDNTMTETNEAVITEALSVIDKALAQMLRRELVSSGEVTDVLLDVRTLLTLPAPVEG